MHSHKRMKKNPAAEVVTPVASAAAARERHASSRLHRRTRTDAVDHRNDRLIIN